MDFEKEWLYHFANHVSKSLLRKKVTGSGNFLWHIFLGRLLIKVST